MRFEREEIKLLNSKEIIWKSSIGSPLHEYVQGYRYDPSQGRIPTSWSRLKMQMNTWHLGKYFFMPLRFIPKHINATNPVIKEIVAWRLRIGK